MSVLSLHQQKRQQLQSDKLFNIYQQNTSTTPTNTTLFNTDLTNMRGASSSSSSSPAISTNQSLPKSLLNLAACSNNSSNYSSFKFNQNNNQSTSSSTSNISTTKLNPPPPPPPNCILARSLLNRGNATNVDFDPKEIKSAISRVKARNDLSLLYPPMLLGANSQKHLNEMSVGSQMSQESESFTPEVRRIVSEECNIIYECKKCSNLFRSLANLVKHKRNYCNNDPQQQLLQQHTNVDLQRKPNETARDLMPGPTNQPVPYSTKQTSKDQTFTERVNSLIENLIDNKDKELNDNIRFNGGIQNPKYHLGSTRQPDIMVTNNMRPPISRPSSSGGESQECSINSLRNFTEQSNSSKLIPTNLSKLLQSQPRNKSSVVRDSSPLMNALRNKPSTLIANDMTRGTFQNAANEFSDNDGIASLNDQLVSQSSLAQTLLNENAKSLTPVSNQVQQRKVPTPRQQLKHVASKRKLEDCISKVKRNKLGASETIGNYSPVQKQSACNSSISGATSETNQTSPSALLRALTCHNEVGSPNVHESAPHSSRLNKYNSNIDGDTHHNTEEEENKDDEDEKEDEVDKEDNDDKEEEEEEEDKEEEEEERGDNELDDRNEDIEDDQVESAENDYGEDEDEEAEDDADGDGDCDGDDDDEDAEDDEPDDDKDDADYDDSDRQKNGSESLNNNNILTATNAHGTQTGGASSGGMKLKIQLKTQPDEKTKVYRIV